MMRETLISVAVGAAIVAVAAFAGALAFLGAVVHPVFWLLAAILVVGATAGGLWVWWTTTGTTAPQPDDDTELIDTKAISDHEPAPPRAAHRFDADFWRRVRRRVRSRGSRVKEGVSS